MDVLAIKDENKDSFDKNKDQIFRYVVTSPRTAKVVNSTKKDKKHGNREVNQPVKVQLKKNMTSQQVKQ